MKFTKQELKYHTFFVVPVGFQPMSKNGYSFEDTVTNERAVRVEDNIFCSAQWHSELMKQLE